MGAIQLQSNSIIGVPFDERHPLRSLLYDGSHAAVSVPEHIDRRLFQVRLANTDGSRSGARVLVDRRYASRGYRTSQSPARESSNRITLTASEQETTIGTITIGFDSPAGLLVDEIFGDVTSELRRAGQHLCEFTKLAMDSVVTSRRVLASLFHVAYIYSRRIVGAGQLLIEVNPRHVNYYRRMLGFTVVGERRLNRRVEAPALLLGLDLSHAEAQIAHFGGHGHRAAAERSLYPHFFSPAEEDGIVGRLNATARCENAAATPDSVCAPIWRDDVHGRYTGLPERNGRAEVRHAMRA